MTRRKQICPKRMKYDAKGQEIVDTSPNSADPSADEQSETETSPVGSPTSPVEPLSPMDREEVMEDRERKTRLFHNEKKESDNDENMEEDSEVRLPSKRPRIMDPVSLEVPPKSVGDGRPPSPAGQESQHLENEDSRGKKVEHERVQNCQTTPQSPKVQGNDDKNCSLGGNPKGLFQPSSSPPQMHSHSDHDIPARIKTESKDAGYKAASDVAKLVPSVRLPASSDRHDKTKSDLYRDRGNNHKSRHGGGSHRKSYSERVRDRHSRDSSSSHQLTSDMAEQSAYKSLAKKYADLFKSSLSMETKVKDEKSSRSYEPLKAVQDMVKAAERRSPVTPPHTSYHSRFDYLKQLTGSPSSLEALQRVVDKDRSISHTPSTPEKRPSVVQSVSKAYPSPNYQKYLQLPAAPQREKSPLRTPDPDPDKPLDLSVKTKKSKEPSRSTSSTKRSLEAPQSFLSPPPPDMSASSPSGLTSTLASLEQKFGDNSFMFDRIGSKNFNTPIRQFYMSAFGMGIYSSALNNSYPFPPNAPVSTSSSTTAFSQSLMASKKSPVRSHSAEGQTPSRKSSVSSLATPSEDNSKSYVPSKFLEQAMKESGIDPKKHTNLQCSCGDEFETLYGLTLHLQETGHPANKTKNGTQQDYPKLVRGQDMWLNHGSEQTKQILRCMQCGVSFKSLPELTVHMIQTKHYTNIVGTETPTKSLKVPKSSLSDCSDAEYSTSHKCPKCQELFEDFEGLVRHQDKTGHLTLKYEADLDKDEVSPPRPTSAQSDRETAISGLTRSSSSNSSVIHFKRHLLDSLNDPRLPAHDNDSRDSSFSSPSPNHTSHIRCENCAERIKTEYFVEHVRQCVRIMCSPVRARSRSRSRSPIYRKHKDYLSEYQHRKSAVKEEEQSSRSREYDNRRKSEDPDRFFYYGDFRSEKDDKTHLRPWSMSERNKNSSSKPETSQNVPRDFTVDSSTELVKPPDTDKDGCALKAMESFIERSFTHNTPRKPAQSSSLFSTSLFARNFFASHPQQPQSRPPERQSMAERLSPAPRRDSTSPQPQNSHLYQNKYLPPLYMAPEGPVVEEKDPEPMAHSPPSHTIKRERSDSPKPVENGLQKHEKTPDKNDNTVIDTSATLRKLEALSDAEKSDPEEFHDHRIKSRRSKSPEAECTEDLSMKTKERCDEDTKKSSGSALQSLQGLVYGKSFNTEHPLDSLQKLIHTTSSTVTSHTMTTSRSALSPSLVSSAVAATTSLPGTVILVNPIVTVVSSSKGGSPSLQISLPPGSPGDSKDRQSPFSDTYSNHDNKSPTPGGEGDSSSENRCDACNRNFASKGSYRYHQSRCHWSTVKKFRIKEAINTSPYVYLPLDHSAKFNKYYEMANELASKGK